MLKFQTLIRFILLSLVIAVNACAPAAAQTSTPTEAPIVAASPTTAAPTIAPTVVPTVVPTAVPQPTAVPTASSSDSAVFTANGAFFALSVADAQASSKWYQDKFGLKIVLQPPRTAQSTVIVLEGGGLIVELIQETGSKPLSEVAPAVTDKFLVHGIQKVGVIVDDFDQTVATLRERGVKIVIGPFPKSSTQRANVIVEDNAGNLIQFFGK